MRIFGADITYPWFFLVALAALPAWWWSARGAGRVVFSSLRALPGGGETWRTRLSWVPDVMVALAIVAFAIALAGPRKGKEASRIHREGIAVMMAVDVSGSMRALDLSKRNRELSRLDAVKEVFARFADKRDDDAIGLVAFARYAETRSPLTLDHANLIEAARQLDFAPENEDGTAIGAGLELAVQRLADYKAKSKIAILLTDGESNVHEIDEDTAIQDAIDAGIKVYTIGAGTQGIAPIRVPVGNGRTELMQTKVNIDEVTLRKIADKTGGQYFRATDNASLDRIYGEINKLERTSFEEATYGDHNYYFDIFLAIAMGLVVGSLLLRATALRRLP